MTRHSLVSVAPQINAGLPQQPSTASTDASLDDNDGACYTIHTRLLFDPLTLDFQSHVSIRVSRATGLVVGTEHRPSLSPSSCTYARESSDLDLTHLPLCIPGMTDLHTHILLHLYSSAPSNVQETQESPVERIIRATNHLRRAIKAGFTTYRDLGTEGLFTADLDIRNAVARGLIPGPRVFAVGEAIASSGGYAVRSENDTSGSLGFPYSASGSSYALGTTSLGRISDPGDGVDGVRAAVRRRLATGADLIKVYIDYGARALRWPAPSLVPRPSDPHSEIRFPPAGSARSPPITLWTQEELDVLVQTARAAGASVAAHATTARSVLMAVNAGVTTVEHGSDDEEMEMIYHPFAQPLEADIALKTMAQRGTIWNPTLRIMQSEHSEKDFQRICDRVRRAYNLGVQIGVGGDTGPVLHGENSKEIELLVEKCGLPLEYALRAATLGGWEAIWGRRVDYSQSSIGGKERVSLGKIVGIADSKDGSGNSWSGQTVRRFGVIREGWVADLVGLNADVRDGLEALDEVMVVVKDGQLVVSNGSICE